MGYYTAFSIDYSPYTDEIATKTIEALLEYEEFDGWIEDYERVKLKNPIPKHYLEDMISADTMKWYDHTQNMQEVSAKIPEAKFSITGRGEDWDDYWREYYYNGKVCHCPGQVVYAEPSDEFAFDEED